MGALFSLITMILLRMYKEPESINGGNFVISAFHNRKTRKASSKFNHDNVSGEYVANASTTAEMS